MNEKIKEILQDNGIYISDKEIKEQLNSAIIEICEAQKKECAEHLYVSANRTELLKLSKNIAQ